MSDRDGVDGVMILRTLDYVTERWGSAAPEPESVYGL